mgnify:CR=1 FL=1
MPATNLERIQHYYPAYAEALRVATRHDRSMLKAFPSVYIGNLSALPDRWLFGEEMTLERIQNMAALRLYRINMNGVWFEGRVIPRGLIHACPTIPTPQIDYEATYGMGNAFTEASEIKPVYTLKVRETEFFLFLFPLFLS